MRCLNRTEIIGRVGGDPDFRYTAQGNAVAHFRVAVTRRWRNTEGQPQDSTEWFRVVAQGRFAEMAHSYVEKGDPVYIEGRLETRSYEAADGQTRYISEVIVRELIVLSPAKGAVDLAGYADDDDS